MLAERPLTHLGSVTIHDDEAAARVFRTLSDPISLRMLLHVLERDQCDSDIAAQLGMTPRAAAAALDRLIAAGLMVRTPSTAGTQVYRVPDASTVEHLLATVGRLALLSCQQRRTRHVRRD